MKKKNFFAQYKQFTFFLILAVVIILIAVFAPVRSEEHTSELQSR